MYKSCFCGNGHLFDSLKAIRVSVATLVNISKMYSFRTRGHQQSGKKTCTNLALVGLFIFFSFSKRICSNPPELYVRQRVCTHTHTHVNCATLIVAFSKCIHSIEKVSKKTARRRVRILLLLDFSSF